MTETVKQSTPVVQTLSVSPGGFLIVELCRAELHN